MPIHPESGFFFVNKLSGMTSSDTVISLRKKLKIKSLGHTGTLDRFAEGLMILPYGDYTSFSQWFLEKDKTYLATVELGKTTDTFDPDGITTHEWSEIEKTAFLESKENWIQKFKTEIEGLTLLRLQEAPLISALKKSGKRYSDLVRAGESLEPRTRDIQVFSSEFLGFSESELQFQFRVRVSSGTYIRKMVQDLSSLLGIPFLLKHLVREGTGDWSLLGAKSWQDTDFVDSRDWESILPFPKVVLEEKEMGYVAHGGFISSKRLPVTFSEGCLLLEPDQKTILAYIQPPLEGSSRPYRYSKVFFNPDLKNPVFKSATS